MRNVGDPQVFRQVLCFFVVGFLGKSQVFCMSAFLQMVLNNLHVCACVHAVSVAFTPEKIHPSKKSN